MDGATEGVLFAEEDEGRRRGCLQRAALAGARSNYSGNNQKSDRRRKALGVEEKPEEKTDEPCTSSSSSESDSSEDEKGLVCLFSQEDSDEELCFMAEEEEEDFDDVRNTHFRLKEENARLLTERQDLKDLKSKNAEMLESIS
nr:lisH domain-containing protein C1711.05-like [Ipomoea batatas]